MVRRETWWDDGGMSGASVPFLDPTPTPRQVCAIKVANELEQGSHLSIIRLVDALIEYAYAARASDVHIDPTKTVLLVRIRVDGVLEDAFSLPLTLHAEIISRIKILCGLRTDEHHSAQDGRFNMQLMSGVGIDIRVSIVPLYYGENTVLRLLADVHELHDLPALGITAANQEKIITALKKPHGMILVTGPTGSGKTTTLYSLIKIINGKHTSIVTIEDPIEYAIAGVNQIQVNARTGLTFGNGLRSMLRQDPNTIMVGEIRDTETARLAVNVALTGHLVLSTLHTNDAATTLPRLLDMQVESYLIASTVSIAIGQRLLRRLCPHCKVARILTTHEVQSLEPILPRITINVGQSVWSSTGCVQCNQTGYYGRVGVQEVLVMTPALRNAVLVHAQASELRDLAIRDGMVPLVEDAFLKVLQGHTTVEEMIKMKYE
jgi:type II secretory ATPase GspE/PulE/Tfp pilus assembly ATPase PilB-like protein